MTDSTLSLTAHRELLQEQRYRRQFLGSDANQNTIVFLLFAVSHLIAIRLDVILLRGSVLFYVAVGARLIAVLMCFLLAILLQRAKWPRQHDRIVAGWMLGSTALLSCVYLTRYPAGEYLGVVFSLAVVVGVFCFGMKGAMWPRILTSGMGMIALTILMWNPKAVITPLFRSNALITLGAFNLLGLLSARGSDVLRRKQFQAEQKERQARRELAQKLRELAAEKERTEAMARVRTAFLASMSHEFRTPMNAVIGLSDLLMESPLAAMHKAHVQIINDSARALLRILNDILDFTKIDAQKLSLSPVPFDLRRLVTSVVDMLQPSAKARSLSLTLTLSPALPDCLLGDDARLRQVLVNLVSNAIKFTEQGSVRIEVDAAAASDPTHEITVQIIDTGIGMTPEVMTRLFQPFVQGEAGIARRYGGSGLGLTISRQIIQAMGGDIQVASQPGQGSVFSVLLRLPKADCPGLPYHPIAPADSLPALRVPLLILVVDDHLLNREVAQAKLCRLGYQVELASDGPEAIQAVAQRSYDVVLMDLQMPGMSGIEATRHILASLGDKPAPHIVALTASVYEEDRQSCRQAGMCDFIGKPIERAQLDAVLSRVIAERAAHGILTAQTAPLSQAARDQLVQIERAGQPDFVAKLHEIFLTDTRKRLPRMTDALQRGDIAELAREAHILRSASATVGAMEMSTLSGQIEDAARAGQQLRDWLQALTLQLPQVERALGPARP